jgi:hypothetical protein
LENLKISAEAGTTIDTWCRPLKTLQSGKQVIIVDVPGVTMRSLEKTEKENRELEEFEKAIQIVLKKAHVCVIVTKTVSYP